MKKYLINYADITHIQSQKNNTCSGKEIAKFDEVIEYSKKNIDDDFLKKNNHILSQRRGAGYWLWKPYIIYKTLNLVKENDVVFYSDSGISFLEDISELLPVLNSHPSQMLVFELDVHKNKTWTKRDCFVLTDCNTSEFADMNMILASYMIMKKSHFVMNFIENWLTVCQDYRAITDCENELGLNNYKEFIDHRHDQSVLSLISRKFKVNVMPDISQYGNNIRNTKQIINHHRNTL